MIGSDNPIVKCGGVCFRLVGFDLQRTPIKDVQALGFESTLMKFKLK
jgi:hypothetical protein